MHALLVAPVDTADHPAARHLTTAIHTALSGSVVIGAFPRPESAGHVDPVGQAGGDDVLHEGTGSLFTTWVGAVAVGPAAMFAGPLHRRLPVGAAASAPWGSHA
ncbi:hypothetical protein OG920_01490 [Streptomyces europaeiscabiei]|uniref:hypothetical protein n=1 Tax=Streptomyces TaxID=1883 RepID=UPI000A3BEFF4|nr:MULTISPECIES: hypothetical protein [Streptomyces]MDX3615253.1 hypothetical protein [Streptomyces europaeiscabiei]MDX3637633.1 hypothetical protein [Streptomyces europaeiscabiei]MDX3654896.1 hypothetical protein [Streptomyces europaeiscabiei]